MYSKCGDLHSAHYLFEQMPHRNIVSWTSLVSGLAQNGHFSESLKLFSMMRKSGLKPTQFAFSSAIQAATSIGSISCGKRLHSLSLKLGLNIEMYVGSNLADMYSKCGCLDEACRVFAEMPCKDEVSWTAMIDGCAKNGNFEEALVGFKKMVCEGIGVDQFVFCSTLGACAALRALAFGRGLHSCVVKLGFGLVSFVGNALTDMYSKVGDMESASRVFGVGSECQSVVSCTSLIDGYAEMGRIEEAFVVFIELRRQDIEPNEYTFCSLIKACANQAALDQGVQVHAHAMKSNFEKDPFVYAILVDMYGKCGLLDSSIQVFDEIGDPTEIAWNSLLGVYAHHGLGKEAVKTFEEMVGRGINPNEITFVSLLVACSHNGLVEEGLNYFNSMKKSYGIVPKPEHFSCVIDLLGRAGRLKEAEEFINSMPFEPNAMGWCSFLSSCRTCGDKERGELAAEKLMRLEPENSGTHVLLSKIYALVRQWDDVRILRKVMKDGKVKKSPGYSWVDVANKTHVFGAENWSHPQQKEIYEKLESLMDQIKQIGYVPKTNSVLCNINDSLKERHLNHHSERIAVAFALISMPAAKPIIVKKNLRVCVDCHSAIKFISKVVQRKISVRDNSRFHHFMDGSCSCGDYW
ncbi:hypothetical protein Sjap_012388 [Stephania japonica]|uniref:DYW domain-containing protein n=1 Tax=Stephania japonica TaxID=461633 RepID=A0AAP0P0A8_9MAGN